MCDFTLHIDAMPEAVAAIPKLTLVLQEEEALSGKLATFGRASPS